MDFRERAILQSLRPVQGGISFVNHVPTSMIPTPAEFRTQLAGHNMEAAARQLSLRVF
jgi:hypothetical protein